MTVYVVTLCDLYQDHLCGIYSSHEAAQSYIDSEEAFRHQDESYVINEMLVKG
jgi:hypothetical protein